MKRAWKPAGKINLAALEDRLPSSKKLITAWIPGRGACYMIVDAAGHRKKARFIY